MFIRRRIAAALSQLSDLRRGIERNIECISVNVDDEPLARVTKFTFEINKTIYGFAIPHSRVERPAISFPELLDGCMQRIEHSHLVRVANRCGLNQRLAMLREKTERS